MKTVAVLAYALLLLPSFGHCQDKEVRDSHGQLVETWRQHGSTTEVRDRHGTLLETRTQRGADVYVRDRNGRLLRIETLER
ncbi:MAG: hypothetical protein ACP5M0_12005 [Desulfomonilaceae bacterium]